MKPEEGASRKVHRRSRPPVRQSDVIAPVCGCDAFSGALGGTAFLAGVRTLSGRGQSASGGPLGPLRLSGAETLQVQRRDVSRHEPTEGDVVTAFPRQRFDSIFFIADVRHR